MPIESLRDIQRASVSAFAAGGITFTASATPPSSPNDGDRWLDTDEGIEYVWYDSTWATYSPSSTTFTGLTDTPSAYTGAALKAVRVNAAGTALEFTDFSEQFRQKLTANRTYYVRTDGSDSNDGLANTIGGAFLTLQKAFDTLSALDLVTFAVTVQVADGTYGAGIVFNKPIIGGSGVHIVGNTTTPSNVVLSSSTAHIFQVTAAQSTKIFVGGFKVSSTLTSGCGFLQDAVSRIDISYPMDFGTCSGSHVRASVPGTYFFCQSISYSITGGAGYHMFSVELGGIRVQSCTVTLTGTPAFSSGFAGATQGASILAPSNTYSGAATGLRYNVTYGGLITVNGAGATYFPGSTSGSQTTGGLYQ